MKPAKLRLTMADEKDRQWIYRMRHSIYASELGQHAENPEGSLQDKLDAFNSYLVARAGDEIAGFISITPPGSAAYSIDKYLPRHRWPFPCDENLFEVRLLTVIPKHRRSEAAFLLMYGALRWVESHCGSRIMAIGRSEILNLYRKAGLQTTGQVIHSGKVQFEVMHQTTERIRAQVNSRIMDRIEQHTDWRLDFPLRKPAACFHGGTFFGAIGEKFDFLKRSEIVINADVLDAWFPPSPKVISALQEYLPWLLRTSPPNEAQGLVETIAEVRGVSSRHILPGAGSSDLIFRAFPNWLNRTSRALILDPIYSEYPHILEKVVGCKVDRFKLDRSTHYAVDLEQLKARMSEVDYDLLVLVNPNSPTGQHVPKGALLEFLKTVPLQTRVWIDETYIDYVGASQSVEQYAAHSPNVVVCKSMSKVYALSGARVAYLCASPHLLEELRALTPPWVIGLPAQVAAVKALQDPEYYAAKYLETHQARESLAASLAEFGWEVVSGCANFFLVHLPADGPDTNAIITACRQRNLFLRNPANMGTQFDTRTLRIAVKDEATNQRMLEIIREVLGKT